MILQCFAGLCMNLNIPDTRQSVLEQRLKDGQQIVAAEVAREFEVSLDTIRRDILSLEAAGKAHRVRGGAIPVAVPVPPLHQRIAEGSAPSKKLIAAAVNQVGQAATLILDGGSTVLALARALPVEPGRLVMTPSPWIAIACQERGIEVFMLGGKLSASGGVSVGSFALDRAAEFAADVAVMGACGLDVGFGLSSDDQDESDLKRVLHRAARRTLVLRDGSKIGQRSRYQTLSLNEIDLIITDAHPDETDALVTAGAEIHHA